MGAPLAGWIVRYNVGGGASLGYEGGNSVVVWAFDAWGQAAVAYSHVDQDLSPPNVWFFGAQDGQIVNADHLTPSCGVSDFVS